MLSFVFTMSDCHITIITLIQWIKIDHVLFLNFKMIKTDSWGTVHYQGNIIIMQLPMELYGIIQWTVQQLSTMIISNSTWSILIQ